MANRCAVLVVLGGDHIDDLLQVEVLGVVAIECLFIFRALLLTHDGWELTAHTHTGGGVNMITVRELVTM